MSSFTLAVTIDRPYPEVLEAVRSALTDVGFGILTEIDMKATLKQKLDVDVEPQVILGACRPLLAHQAILAEPSIATVLPCNVVVRSMGDDTTVVEAFDPEAMVKLADNTTLNMVAADAKARLQSAFAALAQKESTKEESWSLIPPR